MRPPRKTEPGAPMRWACLLAWVMCPGAATTAWAEVRVEVEHVNPGTKVKQVIVVFKTHFDIGYTDLARNIVTKYRTEMIDKALEVCDRSESLPPEQRFVWTLSGWPMTQILWKGQTPERRARVENAVREGRLVWHALPYTLETEGSDLEDIVRGLRFSSDLSREFGMPLPRDAKMTDVPSHSWAVPTILKHAGVDFLHLGCNPASSSPDVPDLFWWEGPDGSRLLTMYSAKDYGTGVVPPRDWPFQTWLALIHTGDNQGPPSPEEVEALLAQARRDLPGVELKMGWLSDFGDAILKENPDLPVVRGDMPDTWIHGFMSMPPEAKLARNIRPRIAALESLNTLLRGWQGEAPDEKKTLAAAYEKSLMYGEHTWGLSGGSVGFRYGEEWRKARESEELGPRYRRSEESWREHGAYIEAARDLVEPELEKNLAALARSVKVKGERIVVFNPLPWARDSVVEVDAGGAGISGLKDKESGDVLPVEAREGKVRFVAREVPAMGYKTFVPAKPKRKTNADGPRVDENAGTIENAFYKVTLDRTRGGIASIVDKRTGRELVDAAGKHACGQYLYERFDAGNVKSYLDAYVKTTASWAGDDLGKRNLPGTDQFRYTAASPAGFTVKWEASGACACAVMRAGAGGGVPHAVTTRIALYRDEPYVDIEWGVKDKEPDPWPEGGWICLPFNVKDPVFELGRLGSIVNPTRDVIRSSNHDIYCLSSGMTVTNPDGVGVGLCALDSPLVSLERPGLWKYSRDFLPARPEVFVNLFNNQWSTNFQMWTGGSWTSRVRVWAVDKTDGEAGLQTPSWEARVPCVAAFFDGPKGDLPLSQAGLELSRKGVLVTAFGPNPDGEGTILRLWEQVGDAAPCKVQLPKGMKVSSVQPCNLRGQAMGRPIPVKRGSFEVPMTPFAPVTVIIRMKAEG